jgi:hypothetical protein
VTSPVPGSWYMLAYINRQQKKDFVQQVTAVIGTLTPVLPDGIFSNQKSQFG